MNLFVKKKLIHYFTYQFLFLIALTTPCLITQSLSMSPAKKIKLQPSVTSPFLNFQYKDPKIFSQTRIILELILEQFLEPALLVSHEGEILYCNEASTFFLKKGSEELNGSFIVMISPELEKYCKDCYQASISRTNIIPFRRKIKFTNYPIHTENEISLIKYFYYNYNKLNIEFLVIIHSLSEEKIKNEHQEASIELAAKSFNQCIRTPLQELTALTEELQESELNEIQKHLLKRIQDKTMELNSVTHHLLKIENSPKKKEFLLMSEILNELKIKYNEFLTSKKIDLFLKLPPNIKPEFISTHYELKRMLEYFLDQLLKDQCDSKHHFVISSNSSQGNSIKLRFDFKCFSIQSKHPSLHSIINTQETCYEWTQFLASQMNTILQVNSSDYPTLCIWFEAIISLNQNIESSFNLNKVFSEDCLSETILLENKYSFYRILLVEDNHIILKMYKKTIEKSGFISNETATNGKEAIQKVLQFYFHLVLIDNQMPELSGIKTTEIIRQLPIQQPMIIMISADHTKKSRQEALEAGVDAFYSKPLSTVDLIKIVKENFEKTEL